MSMDSWEKRGDYATLLFTRNPPGEKRLLDNSKHYKANSTGNVTLTVGRTDTVLDKTEKVIWELRPA